MTIDIDTDSGTEPAELQRLHFLTPWVNAGRLLLVTIGASVALLRDDPARVIDAWSYIADQPVGVVIAVGFAAFVIVVGSAVGYSFVSWRMTGYALVGPTLYVRRGVLVKQRRKVRLDRLQGVDVFQPLIARVFGLASLKLEMAAGGEATTTLGLFTLAEAHELRAELLSFAGRSTDVPERLLLEVPTGRVLATRLVAAALPLSVLVIYVVTVATIGVVVGAGVGGWLAAVAPVVPVVAITGRSHARAFLREANFKLGESDDGLRIHSGLVTLNHRTIPPRRIQGLHIEVPFVWRYLGWARLTVDVAGSATSTSDTESFQPASNTLVPVASVAEVMVLFDRIAHLDLEQVEFVRVPARSRRLDPIAAGWSAVGVTETAAVSRTGAFDRRTAVVPFARIQSVRARQGILQRRLNLATLHLDGPVGATAWKAPHRDAREASILVCMVAAKAASARLAES